MKKSKISILLLFIVMILAISAVSAADAKDTSDSAVQAVDETPVEEVASADVGALAATDGGDVVAEPDDGNNFTSLSNKIKNSQHDFAQINKDYAAVEGDQVISIEKDFALISTGGNHKIDAKNLCGIFEIKEGVNFILEGITLVNGHADNGGAIVNNGELQLINCIFENNNATNYGGAIYNLGELDIDDCTFKDNTATYKGGAVYSVGTVDVSGSTFDGNDIKYRSGKNTDFNGGAAIYNLKGNLTVDNSKFKNNVKNYEIRSATDFDNLDGAVTSISGTVAISNSEFRNNSARYGSAILISSLQDGADGTFTIDNCQFYDNLALAGAIQVWDRDKKFEFTILNSWFENNTATGITDPDHTAAGGALAFIDVKEAKINGTTFKENKVTNIAKKPKGGAINIQGSNVDIDYCTFEANHADTNGGAINVYSGSVDVNNSKFINNDATINGGAINLDNYTAYGYAIAVANVENSNFTGNTATAAGNAIYNNGKLALSGNTIDAGANIVSSGTITSPIIAVVTADKTTYRIEQITLTARLTDDMGTVINDTTFKFVFNTPAGLAAIPATLGDDGNYTVRFTPTKDGEYNVTVNHAGDITNATFTVYRTLTDLKELVENATDGDTINLDGDYTYNDEFDASFTGIVTSSSLTINGNGYTICGQDKTCNLFNVSGHKLTLNNLTICHFNNTVDGLGGAISVSPSGTLTANYVNFTDNTAKYKGGAIYNNGGTVIVNHTVFDGNDIKYRSGANTDFNGGAAIYNLKGTLTVDDSTIKNNVKNYEIRSDTDFDNLDGAITSISGTVAISNSEFRNNSARYGSAILISAVDDADGTFTIDNCQFYDNLALAGAIQVWDRKNKFEFTILNSWFENNTATGDTDIAHTAAGGALVLTNVKEAKINGTTFKENKVIHIAKKPKGGAINIQDCNHVDIDYCTFEGNHADTNGGAINVYSGSVDVNNSKFINNDATINGGAINIENNTAAGYAIGVATVENSNFTGNTAANGNAINNNGKLTLSKNIISTNQADIVSEGEIESQINVTTHNAVVHYGEKVNLTATITDDKGNLINSSDFYFVVNTVNYGPAVYNPATGKYEFEQEFSLPVGTYEITMYREGKELTYVEKGNLTATPKKGTYSDLQAQIDALAPGETLELTYDFAYDATYDDAKFPNGVVINKALTINGNDHFISGADTVRIFRIGTFANANISGVVFKNGKADKGGALFVAGKLSIDNCTFVNNTATVSGNDIHIMTSSVVVVNGEDSYNYLLNDPDSSLNKYYADNPREDGIDANGNPVHDSTTPIVGHSWESAITTWMDPVTIDGTTYAWQDGYSKFPWILINLDDYTGPIVFKYDGEIKFVWDVANKQRGVISVLEDLKMPDYTLTYQYGTVRDKVFDPNLLTVEYNGTSAGKAVIMLSTPGDIVSIKNSVFDSDGYSIYNLGALDLENNTIKGVIYNNGTIISEINAVVLDNKTINVTSKTYELNATLTDDIGNKIYDPELRFTVNGEKIADKPDYNNGLYTFTSNKFTTDYPSYLIDLSSDNEFSLAAETGIIINVLRGTFTDLQQRIDAANSELNLTYNFTYSDEFDSALKDGVVIDESIVINGNAVTIDANNTARIFNITNNAVLTLTNATLTNGKANLGGAIYVNAGSTLKADYVNFTNNNATYKGGAVYSKGTVIANHTVFDGNDIEYRASRNNRDFNGGAAIYNSKGTLTVDNSIIKNNVKNYGIRNATDYDNLDGAITSISGIVNISNSEFRNNSARYGSAILISSEDATDGTFTIDTCQFYDNIALAGAIQVWDRSNKFEFTILNSWFENNTATGNTTLGHTAAGGALVLNSVKKAKINGTTFKENKVTHIANNPKGGAINIEKPTYLPDAIVDIEIDNCTFDNNHADSNGGAINLNDGNLNVINSKFINNDATNNGGAIHVEKGAADVEGSNFTGNTATKGASIYNAGNLTLSKNNITSGKSEIESTGLIKSELNATFLDNKTWNDTGIGDIYTLNATLTDDNGNNIYDPNFKFAVNGDEIYDIIYDNETGVYRTGYAIKTAGYKVISSKYEADGLTKYTGALDIALENLTDFTVTVEDIIEGENATVFIRAYSTNNLGEQIAADGKVTVILNNTKYTIDVVNGTGNKTIEGLAHGQYPVTAIFEKNSNYNEAINATVFYVRSTQANLTVEIEDIKYGEALTVNINLTDADGNPLTAIVVVNIAGEDYYVPVIGGIASLDIPEKFNVTKYNYTVTFESELYNTTIYKDSFNVIPLEVYLGVRTNDGVAVGEEGEIKVIIYDDYDNIFAGEEVELVFTNETGDIVAVCKILTADDIRGPEGSYVLDFTKDWEIGRYYVSVKSQNFIFKQSSDEDEDPAYYQFTSYAVDGTEWGTGIAEVNGSSSGYIKVKVVSNSYSDEFVGKVFFIVDSAVADGETLYELFDENAVGTGIFVKVSPAFEYLVHKKMIDAVVIEGDGDYVYGDEHIVVIDLGNYVDAYNFTSYGDEACTIEYGIGIVEVGDVVGDYISVKVISNDFDDRFVGQTFYVLDKEYGEDEPIQLSMMNDNNEIVPVNLWVKVSELRDYYNLINITCPATVIVLWEDDEQQYNKTIETEFVNGELSVDLSGLKPGEYTLIVKIDDATYELHSYDYDRDIEYPYALLYPDDYLFKVEEDHVYVNNVNGTDWTQYGDERIFNFELWHHYWIGDNDVDELFVYNTTASVIIYSVVRDENGTIISIDKLDDYVINITDGISDSINLTHLNAGEYKVTVMLIDTNYTIEGWDEDVLVIYGFTSYGDENGITEYGVGMVAVIGDAEDGYIPVRVILNVPDSSFDGQLFYIKDDAKEDELNQLYKMNDNNEFVSVDIWVSVSKLSDKDTPWYAEHFNVDKAGVEVNVNASSITYGETANVTITVVIVNDTENYKNFSSQFFQ